MVSGTCRAQCDNTNDAAINAGTTAHIESFQSLRLNLSDFKSPPYSGPCTGVCGGVLGVAGTRIATGDDGTTNDAATRTGTRFTLEVQPLVESGP